MNEPWLVIQAAAHKIEAKKEITRKRRGEDREQKIQENSPSPAEPGRGVQPAMGNHHGAGELCIWVDINGVRKYIR